MGHSELSRIIDQVGREAFEAVASQAREHAPTTGIEDAPSFDSSLLQDVCSRIEASRPGSHHTRLRLLLQLYERAPAYAVLMHARLHRANWSASSRRFLWRRYRRWIGSEPALSRPAAYSLWCDWFEDSATVHQAWRAMLHKPWHAARIARVLEVSGPVPWQLKHSLYEQLLALKRSPYHLAVFCSLLNSHHDAYGRLDVAQGREILARLELPEDLPEREALAQALA